MMRAPPDRSFLFFALRSEMSGVWKRPLRPTYSTVSLSMADRIIENHNDANNLNQQQSIDLFSIIIVLKKLNRTMLNLNNSKQNFQY